MKGPLRVLRRHIFAVKLTFLTSVGLIIIDYKTKMTSYSTIMLAILLIVVIIIILYFVIKNIMLWLTWHNSGHKYSPVDAVDLERTYPNSFTKFQNTNFEIDSE